MHHLKIWFLMSSLLLGSVACHGDQEDEPVARTEAAERSRAVPRLIQQIEPPVDLEAPPADATKTASGLSYKKLVTRAASAQAKASDTVLVHYTGWRRTGETFFATRARGRPIALDIAHAAPGFAEILPLLRKGEKAVLWVPPSKDTTETLVYEIEVVDVVSPSAVAKRAPAVAKTSLSSASGVPATHR
jgi:FKBP-type peptidyl-prolyl cis-trans isomerase